MRLIRHCYLDPAGCGDDTQMIMNSFKKMYAVNLEDDINKLRIVQFLFLLVSYVTDDARRNKSMRRQRNNLKRIAVGILSKESNGRSAAVRQITQYMYILLLEQEVTFKEIKLIVEKLEEKPDWATSFMPVLYHIMPYCKFSVKEIEEICAPMILFLSASEEKLRLYAQILLQQIYNIFDDSNYKHIWDKHDARIKEINSVIESKQEEIIDILKTDYVFLKVLDPIRDHSLETVLYILPKLNQVNPNEWEHVMKYPLMIIKQDRQNIQKDKNETLNKAVNLFLETNYRDLNYCAWDILNMFKDPSQNPVFEIF